MGLREILVGEDQYRISSNLLHRGCKLANEFLAFEANTSTSPPGLQLLTFPLVKTFAELAQLIPLS